MERNRSSSSEVAELERLRATCWRQSQRIRSLDDTISVLRAGANALAVDNAELQTVLTALEAELERRAQVFPQPLRRPHRAHCQ